MSEARQNREAMNRIISKAAWLILDGRVVRISDIMYYVMGTVSYTHLTLPTKA